MSATPKAVSLRRSLLVNLALFVGLFSASLLLAVYVMGNLAASDLSRRLLEKSSELTAKEISTLFDPVATAMDSCRSWMRLGALDLSDTQRMNAMLKPLIGIVPQVTSINTGTPAGDGYLLLLTAKGWSNRLVSAESVGRFVDWTEPDGFGGVVSQRRPSDYDPRKRPWYVSAMAAGEGELVWSKPYQFLSTQEPGITASMRIEGFGEESAVVAMDVLLKDLGAIAERIQPSPNGFTVILDRDGKVIGIPEKRLSSLGFTGQKFQVAAEDMPWPPLREAVRLWRAEGADSGWTREFSLEDGRWWAKLQTFTLKGGSGLIYAVLIPQNDLLGDLYTQMTLIVAISVAVMLVSLVVLLFFIKRVSKPLESLSSQTDLLRRLDLSAVEPVESSHKEVHKLWVAQSCMRTAISSFIRYLPMDVVRDLLDRDAVAEVGGEKRDITVLCTDIAGFTSLSERMTPQELTTHLSNYLESLTEVLQKHGGTIDKFIGDAVVCLWNAPRDMQDHTRRALDAVWECKARIEEVNANYRAAGLPEMSTRFGMHRGSALVGNVGSRTRLNFTALGQTVNLAGELEALNKKHGTVILVSEEVRRHAGQSLRFRHVGATEAFDQAPSLEVYEFLGPAG